MDFAKIVSFTTVAIASLTTLNSVAHAGSCSTGSCSTSSYTTDFYTTSSCGANPCETDNQDNCCVTTQCCTNYKSNFQVYSYLEGGVNVVNGYAQVPPIPILLGSPIPSHERPRFSELDIDSDLYYALGMALKYGSTWSYLQYRQLTPSNTTTLNSPLSTLGHIIDAGQLFAMKSYYQWIGFGLGVEYCLIQPCLRFTPVIDINWVNYAYQFSAVTQSGYQNLKQERNGLVTVRLGARLDYDYRDLVSWQFTLMGSPPFTPLTIYEGKISVAYHLYDKNNFQIRPYIGLSWLYIDLNDKKEFTLHTRYEAVPSIFVGLNFLM